MESNGRYVVWKTSKIAFLVVLKGTHPGADACVRLVNFVVIDLTFLPFYIRALHTETCRSW